MTPEELKAQFNSQIRQQTAANSINPDTVADQLDAIVDWGTEPNAIATLTYAGTVNIDFNASEEFYITLAGNVNFTFSNVAAGKNRLLFINNGAAGPRTINFPGTAILKPDLAFAEQANELTAVALIPIAQGVLVESSVYGTVSGGGGTPTLATPTGLTVTPGDTTLALDWADVPNATGYTVQRATDAGFTTGLSTTTLSGGSNSSYNQFASPNGTLFYVRVKATAPGYNDSDWVTGSGTPAAAGGGYDAATTTLINALSGDGVTLTTGEQDAYNAFIVGLKAGTLWGKMRSFCVLGGSLNKSRRNFKSPASNLLTEVGGTITYGSTGANGDGSASYLNMNIALPAQDSSALFVSQMTTGTGLEAIIGTGASAGSSYIVAGDTFYGMLNGAAAAASTANANTKGRYILSRTSSAGFKAFKNGSLLVNASADTSTNLYGTFVTIGCAGAAYFSNEVASTAGVFDGLSDSEASELDSLVATLETALGR